MQVLRREKENQNMIKTNTIEIWNILEQFKTLICKTANQAKQQNTSNLEVPQDNSVRADSHVFESLVGSFFYIATQTRPDILFRKVSSACNNPQALSILMPETGKRVLRWIQGTKSFKIGFPTTNKGALVGDCRAEWIRQWKKFDCR